MLGKGNNLVSVGFPCNPTSFQRLSDIDDWQIPIYHPQGTRYVLLLPSTGADLPLLSVAITVPYLTWRLRSMSTVYYPRVTDRFDIFAEYVLDRAEPEAKDEVRKWLKPNLHDTGPEHDIYRHLRNSDVQLPNELAVAGLCETAKVFYMDQKFRMVPIVQGVRGGVYYYFVFAFCLYLCRVMWSLISVRKLAVQRCKRS